MSAFDISVLESIVEDDIEMAKVILETFLEDMPNQISSLDDAIKTKSYDIATRVAHTIKGAASNVGAEKLRAIAQDAEYAGKNGDFAAVETLTPKISLAFQEFKAALAQTKYQP